MSSECVLRVCPQDVSPGRVPRLYSQGVSPGFYPRVCPHPPGRVLCFGGGRGAVFLVLGLGEGGGLSCASGGGRGTVCFVFRGKLVCLVFRGGGELAVCLVFQGREGAV